MTLVRRILALLVVAAIGIAAAQPAGFASAFVAEYAMATSGDAMPDCDGCDPDQQVPTGACHACPYLPPAPLVIVASEGGDPSSPGGDELGHGRTMSPEPYPPRTKPLS